jgi:hypothetical protein
MTDHCCSYKPTWHVSHSNGQVAFKYRTAFLFLDSLHPPKAVLCWTIQPGMDSWSLLATSTTFSRAALRTIGILTSPPPLGPYGGGSTIQQRQSPDACGQYRESYNGAKSRDCLGSKRFVQDEFPSAKVAVAAMVLAKQWL